MSPNAAKLSTKSEARRRRGWLAFMLVLVLAIAAGGAGWWFGAGPGAHVTIPTSIVKEQPDAARAALTALGVEVADELEHDHSVDVEAGLIMGSDPEPGASVRKGSTVTLIVSDGPAPTTVGVLAGLTLTQAQAEIEAAGLVMDDDPEYIFGEQAKDVVLTAFIGDTDVSQGGAEGLFQGQAVRLKVSAGPLPSIQGLTIDEATAELAKYEVDADPSPQEQYSDDVAEGKVIGIVEQGEIHPGGTVLLSVSLGPEPVVVPEVIGETWAVAKQQLLDAGFKLDYNAFVDNAPSFFTVKSVDPAPGSSQPKGTTLKVRFEG